MINRHLFKRIARHVGIARVPRVLHHGGATPLFDLPQADRPIVERTAEHDSDDAGPIGDGGRAKQRIDGRTCPILLRSGAELNVTVLNEQVLVRRGHVDLTLADRTVMGGMRGWE